MKGRSLIGLTRSFAFTSRTIREEDWINQAYRLPYVSSYVRHHLKRQRRESEVIQELLRHANLRVTMDTYVQAMSDEKRKAQSKVVEMIMPGIRKAAR